MAPEETLLKIHSKAYLQLLASLGRIAGSKTGRPLSPVWRQKFAAQGNKKQGQGADGGQGSSVLAEHEHEQASASMTRFSAGSYRAALSASGAVCRAVDAVLSGRHEAAFCNVRPPGERESL